LDARGATRVRIAPDESWLCYVTDVTGTPQLWRVSTAGGMPRRLTFECDRVGAYRISPDGTHIAYATDSGGNEKWQLWLMDADGAAVPGGLIVRSDRGRDFAGLATLKLDGTFRWLLTPDHDIEDADASGRRDAYGVNVEGFTEVHLREGERDTIVRGLPPGTFPVDLVGDGLALQGDTLAVAWARYDAPATIFISRRGEAFRALVPPITAGLRADELPDARLVEWPTFDGR